MIANFFQNLNSAGVRYLLISGQATVLYGAATFSEDIDIWVEPNPDNIDTFLEVLRAEGALYYKLTPALTTENLEKGHGFHFVFPGRIEGEVFLDVMGFPPRAVPFSTAAGASLMMDTEWGLIHTIGLKDLVELKKTQRLEDYPIISKLALAWFEQPQSEESPQHFLWASGNIFTLSELQTFFEEHPSAADIAFDVGDFTNYGKMIPAATPVPDALENQLTTLMQQRMAALQQADRVYWRAIIADLKELRARGELMTEGNRV